MLLPLRDNVIVLAVSDPDFWFNSTIIRPESTKDRSDQGIVKAVGPEVRELRIGDYITFSPYSGKVLNDPDEGDKHIILPERACISIVTPPTTKVPNVLIRTADGTLVDGTAEALLQMFRAAIEKMPRVIEQKQKFEQRWNV